MAGAGAGGRRRARAEDGAPGRAVPRARGGTRDADEGAFCEAHRAVQPILPGYPRGLVGDDADDVVADARCGIVREPADVDAAAAPVRGWTATLAGDRALDRLRRSGSAGGRGGRSGDDREA